MNFLNPLFLIGLVAAAIPVLLHLLNLRKLKNIEFSSLKFLKELQKSKIRKLKIKQIILLILRTLIIVFVVIAFSRPIIEGSIPGFETYAKSSIIILIDNSYSMDVSDEFGSRFSQAKKVAEKIINEMKEGDEAIILEMAQPYNSMQANFSKNKEILKQNLSQIKLLNYPASLDNSLKIASKYIEKANNFAKEIFVITDAQNNVFTTEDSVKFNNKNVGVYIIPIGINSKMDFENLSIDSVEVVTKFFQVGKTIELNATVRNHSEKDVKGALISVLFNKQKVAQKTFDIAAKSTKTIPIGAQVQNSGIISASVELENDAFFPDNKRYFGFIVPDKPNIAIFGDAQNNFFLKTLFSSDEATKQVNTNYYNNIQIDNIDLNKYECIILNYSNITENNKNRIKNYINDGGSAIIFPTDPVNENFINLMSELGITLSTIKSHSEKSPASFVNFDNKHTIFDGLFKTGSEGLNINQIETVKIFKILAAKSGISIIESQDGAFLVENQVGEGKVLYFAVSPILNWSNFPLTTLFPALIFRSVFYLSSTITNGMFIDLGANLSLIIPRKFSSNGNFKMIDPSNNEYLTQLPVLPSGAVLSTIDFKEPGVYQIFNSQNKIVMLVAANLTKSESYIIKPDKQSIYNQVKQRLLLDKNIFVLDNYEKLSQDIKRARIGTELWNIFLILALLCAIAEMIVQKASRNDLIEE